MLQYKGFDDRWIASIMNCVKIVTYSVVINGRLHSMITPSCRLRQGFKASIRGPKLTHLFLADDKLLFGDANHSTINSLKDILATYLKHTGHMAKNIANELGVRRVYNIDKYLGLPTMIVQNKIQSFQYLKDKIHD